MKRTPMKRTPLRRISPRTRARYAQAEDAMRVAVLERSAGICEIHHTHRGVDIHHTRKPRRSFTSPDYCLLLCRRAHEQCDAAYSSATGRLVIVPLGDQQFRWGYYRGADKRSAVTTFTTTTLTA